MRDGMIRLRSYTDQLAGKLAMERLKSLGVEAALETDSCGGMYPQLTMLNGMHLLVPEVEADKAREILAESGDAPKGPPWICTSCGEDSEDGFDTCWNCGIARD